MEVDGPLETRTILARRDATEAGLGISVLPDFLCRDAIRDGRLTEVLPRWTLTPARVHALYRVELRNDPRVRALLEILQAG